MNPFTASSSMGLELQHIRKLPDVLYALKKGCLRLFSSFQTTKSACCTRGDARD
jgi:hypothetical protein